MANSDYRFVYTRDDGGVTVVCPSDNCGLTLEQIKIKIVLKTEQLYC